MIKIISIHIPKTAGRSFYQVLKWAYGEKVDVPANMDKFVYFDKLDENYLNEDCEVIHGHFHYRHIEHLHKKNNAKIIVWLSDPLERIISNYYYNVHMNRKKSWKRNAENRINIDLMNFVSREKRRNTMSSFLQGIKPEEIFFCGFIESFEQDLQVLGKKLGWSLPVPNFRINVGSEFIEQNDFKTQYRDITEDTIQQIRKLNTDDIALYERFVKLRTG